MIKGYALAAILAALGAVIGGQAATAALRWSTQGHFGWADFVTTPAGIPGAIGAGVGFGAGLLAGCALANHLFARGPRRDEEDRPTV